VALANITIPTSLSNGDAYRTLVDSIELHAALGRADQTSLMLAFGHYTNMQM